MSATPHKIQERKFNIYSATSGKKLNEGAISEKDLEVVKRRLLTEGAQENDIVIRELLNG